MIPPHINKSIFSSIYIFIQKKESEDITLTDCR